MDVLINEKNILMILEFIEWRKSIQDNAEDGENVESEVADFYSKVQSWVADLKRDILESNSPSEKMDEENH